MAVTLTGIKPTGTPHIGNYFGAIQPALSMELTANDMALFFIADYHALTTIKVPETMHHYRHVIAATWLAFFDASPHHYFYFQSQIWPIFELYWILCCFCPKGLLNRAHAYKSLVESNVNANYDPDRGINHGVFSYPVLMAADILLFHANHIPVGADQKQHVEIAIEIVIHLNRILPTPIPIPKVTLQSRPLVIGTDGQKMSKNYNNTLPLFASENDLKKRISKIKTDSTPLGTPLNWDTCPIFTLYSYMASYDDQERLKHEYTTGQIGYGHAKSRLLSAHQTYFKSAQSRFNALMADTRLIHTRIAQDTAKILAIATHNLTIIKQALGY